MQAVMTRPARADVLKDASLAPAVRHDKDSVGLFGISPKDDLAAFDLLRQWQNITPEEFRSQIASKGSDNRTRGRYIEEAVSTMRKLEVPFHPEHLAALVQVMNEFSPKDARMLASLPTSSDVPSETLSRTNPAAFEKIQYNAEYPYRMAHSPSVLEQICEKYKATDRKLLLSFIGGTLRQVHKNGPIPQGLKEAYVETVSKYSSKHAREFAKLSVSN